MREFKKRQQTGATILRFLVLSVGTLALFMLSVVAVQAAWGMYGTFTVAKEAKDSAEGQLAALKDAEERLSAAVVSFETTRGVEHEIRERFGVAYPGEGEIQIVREAGDGVEQDTENGSLLSKIFNSFITW